MTDMPAAPRARARADVLVFFFWHGTYTRVGSSGRLDANEWFVTEDVGPTGPPASQALTFEPIDTGFTLMTMEVRLPGPEDPDTFMEHSAAGLSSSLSTLDEIVSS